MRYKDEIFITAFAFVFFLLMTLSIRSFGMIPKRMPWKPIQACNQTIYDELYWTAVDIVLKADPMTENEIALKNNAIETLRRLCNGQRSTFEKNNPNGKLNFKHTRQVD